MPALNFQTQFAERVASGAKRQTIRAFRKDKRDPKVGQTLYHFTRMRTKQCRRLGEAVCTYAKPLTLSLAGEVGGGQVVAVCGAPYTSAELARRDGFASIDEMFAWFQRTHGLPFRGLLIRWGELL